MGRRSLHVGVLAYEGCLGTEIFGIADLLLMGNRIATATGATSTNLFDVAVVADRGGEVTTAGGVAVGTSRWRPGFDVLVVPGFELRSPRHVQRALDLLAPEISRIRSAAERGVPVASVCVGAFLLGEAGLLDGRRATTSWLFADELADRYPKATVDADVMIASDGPVTTTAAFNAVHDLALRLIRLHGGDDLARQVARVALVADNRSSQTPYIDDTLLDASNSQFGRAVQTWLLERLREPYDLAAVAAVFHVSTRTLLRRFGEEVGRSPLSYLQLARVNAAKRLLESPEHTVATAMEAVGYVDPHSFRRLFVERVGMTPAAYRRRFRG